MIVPLATIGDKTFRNKGPLNATGLFDHGVIVINECCGNASNIFMSHLNSFGELNVLKLPVTVSNVGLFGGRWDWAITSKLGTKKILDSKHNFQNPISSYLPPLCCGDLQLEPSKNPYW